MGERFLGLVGGRGKSGALSRLTNDLICGWDKSGEGRASVAVARGLTSWAGPTMCRYLRGGVLGRVGTTST